MTRGLDLVVGATTLLLLLPVMVVIALLVKRSSRGPVLFRQDRIGLEKQTFSMLKFRTMYADCDDRVHREYVAGMMNRERPEELRTGTTYKLTNDARITRTGRWLRRTSLDELPQLFNVLRGEMSLVGPRPMIAWEADLLDEEFEPRFAVKPGMTGLWQVGGRNELTMREALSLDVRYAKDASIWLDLKILLVTIPTVVRSAMTGRGVG